MQRRFFPFPGACLQAELQLAETIVAMEGRGVPQDLSIFSLRSFQVPETSRPLVARVRPVVEARVEGAGGASPRVMNPIAPTTTSAWREGLERMPRAVPERSFHPK